MKKKTTDDLAASGITLLSTVVAPAFVAGTLTVKPVSQEELSALLGIVKENLCGHPITNRVLNEMYPDLPSPKRAFWDGKTLGLAVRPKGGVRASVAEGDTQVTIDDLEFALVQWDDKS